MSLKQQCHETWNVFNTRMSQKLKFHNNLNVTNLECNLNWIVIKTGLSLKLECLSNVTILHN